MTSAFPFYTEKDLLKSLGKGYYYEHKAAEMLRAEGFEVEEFSPRIEDVDLSGGANLEVGTDGCWVGTVDLQVGYPDQFYKVGIEVKAMNYAFKGPEDFPVLPHQVIACKKRSWDAHEEKPLAIIRFSIWKKDGADVGGVVTHPATRKARRRWWVKPIKNSLDRGKIEINYCCSRNELRPFKTLVKMLHRHLQKRRDDGMKLVKDGKDLFVYPDNDKQGEWIKKNFEGRKSRTLKARYVDLDGKPAVQLRLVPEKE